MSKTAKSQVFEINTDFVNKLPRNAIQFFFSEQILLTPEI